MDSGFAAGFDLESHTLRRPDGSDIHYYLDRRAGAEPQSILLIIQGSDCNSVARHPTLHEYADVAPGSAVLLVEKYGITRDLPPLADDNRPDCPAEYQQRDTIEQRVLDYTQVISALRKEAIWWDRRVVILAGSSGAGVGELVAALLQETERLVIFGFGARWLEDDMIDGMRASLASAGMPEEARAGAIEELVAGIRKMREDAALDKFASGHSHAAWASMLAFDQLAALRNVPVPVLAIQGGRDQNASPRGARDLIKSLRELGHTNITYVEYGDLDHGFRDEAGVSHRGRVIADIRDWLLGEGGGR
jgi:pimeloyl-ACP methyl ester carboxylesterase